MKTKNRKCPCCKQTYSDYPAISRRDNKTKICPECGRREAIEDFLRWASSINDDDSGLR